MRNAFLKFYALHARFLYYTAVVGGVATFIIMWLIDSSALTRKFFNWPVPGSVEFTESLMVVGIMLPMAYAQYTRAHVRVTLVTKWASPRVQRALFVFAMAVGFLVTVAMAWAAFNYTVRSFVMDEHVWGANVRFPLYPTKAILCLGFVMLAFQFLLDTIKITLFGTEGESDDELAAESDRKERVTHE